MSSLENRVEAAVNDAVNATMNGYAAELPQLRWSLRRRDYVSGVASHHRYSDSEAAEVVSRWAARFGLAPADSSNPGTVVYLGSIDDLAVRVWGVVDRAAYEDDLRQLLARVPDETEST